MYKWLDSTLDKLLKEHHHPHHALLIQGKEGVGLSSLTEAFVKVLLCENPAYLGKTLSHACGQCASCHLIDSGNHPDFLYLSPETQEVLISEAESVQDKSAAASTHIKVQAVRALIDSLTVTSHRNVRRIIVVDPADALNAIAANALLKVLEEPAPNVIFLLLSTQPGKLLPTIRSRCRMFIVSGDNMQEKALAWLEEQNIPNALGWLEASRGAPLAAQQLALEFDSLEIKARSKAWCTADLPQVLATAQGLKRPDLKAWLFWWYRFITDCLRVSQQGQPIFFKYDRGALHNLARRQTPFAWMKYLNLVETQLRSAEHPLSVALVTDTLLVQYCEMFLTKQH